MADLATTMEVLLVEDDPVDARLLRQTLQSAAALRIRIEQVTCLSDAQLRLGRQPRPDVVLLDLGLPDSTGLTTLHHLLAADARLPVVVLTGANDDEVARAAVDAGAQDYLVKGSVSGDVMARVLSHAIERHRLTEALRERVKEMAGVYGISQALHDHAPSGDVCALVARHVASAVQWPARCHVTVAIDASSGTSGPSPGPHHELLRSAIMVGGHRRGHIEVSSTDPDLEPLLPEEQQMLDAAGETVAGWIARTDALRSLADEQERLRALVAELPGLYWLVDTDLRVTSHDGAMLHALGVDDDRYVGAVIHGLLRPEGPDPAAPFAAALAGDHVTFECQWQQRPWRNHVQPMRDDEGRTVGLACLSLDITTERAQRSELEVLAQRAHGLFLHSMDAIIMADDGGACIDANPAACALTGRTHDELLGLHAADLSTHQRGASVEEQRERWEQFVAAGAMTGEFLLRRADGSSAVVEYRAVANIVPGVHLSTLRDVSASRRAHDDLAASEAQFRQLADNASDIVAQLRVTDDGRLQLDYVNPAATVVLGRSVDELLADPSPLRDLLVGDRGAAATTVTLERPDGGRAWLEVRITVADAATTPPTLQVVARDVTARRLTEQALRDALEAEREAGERLRAADRLKSTFLQSISHELRTPLTSVVGYAHTIVDNADRLDAGQATDFTQRILVNARRLEDLLSDLLDVDRLERGSVRLDLRPTELAALVARVADTIDFGDRTCIVDPTPVTAAVDARKVERIIHNLLANSVKHTPPGTTVWATCTEVGEDAVLTVADDGPGIDAVDPDLAFDVFWQGPVMDEAASPGTGIGLALVRQFAMLHGGSVTVAPRRGGGAVFTCSLPRGHDAGVAGAALAALVVTTSAEDDDQAAFGELLQDTVHQIEAAAGAGAAAGVVLAFVQRLGAELVTPDESRTDRVEIDLSVDAPQRLRAAAPRGSDVRRRLENHLPFLVDHARRRSQDPAPSPVEPDEVDPRTGVVRRASIDRVLGHVHGHDSLVLLVARPSQDDAVATTRRLADLGRRRSRRDDRSLLISATELLVVMPDTTASVAADVLARLQVAWLAQHPDIEPLLGASIAATTGGGHRALEEARAAATSAATVSPPEP